mmetsp:Transcript_7271/g.17542  ORF Transcript_7271/g.17542 Transcript_7271/m.17542 type:complete len:219 (-) Transcript_7271:614-1270(-)
MALEARSLPEFHGGAGVGGGGGGAAADVPSKSWPAPWPRGGGEGSGLALASAVPAEEPSSPAPAPALAALAAAAVVAWSSAVRPVHASATAPSTVCGPTPCSSKLRCSGPARLPSTSCRGRGSSHRARRRLWGTGVAASTACSWACSVPAPHSARSDPSRMLWTSARPSCAAPPPPRLPLPTSRPAAHAGLVLTSAHATSALSCHSAALSSHTSAPRE